MTTPAHTPPPAPPTNRLLLLLGGVLFVCVAGLFLILNVILRLSAGPSDPATQPVVAAQAVAAPAQAVPTFWQAPDIELVADASQKKQIEYGRDLIARTAAYLGPKGSVRHITNGMNCQNCHLDAGTRVFGNNYGAVASTYPKFRARSGGIEDIHKRVNDCIERSLNGQPLDTASAEMQAIRAYILFLGSNVPKGEKTPGSGLKALPYLDRAADPQAGEALYQAKCQSCHQQDGGGLPAPDGITYTYPPLWGKNSYNDGAGLYRLGNFARYIKYNMPLGATHDNPLLSDEEAWDIAAYVNSRPRPHKATPKDWPDISKKPIDHPFGPYADGFSEKQHKFGPFKPLAATP
ncbi:MAG: cytochrome C [Bacteroidetes bacterium]|nr:MAG: cytochrome C [Bacteroidota bacterium]